MTNIFYSVLYIYIYIYIRNGPILSKMYRLLVVTVPSLSVRVLNQMADIHSPMPFLELKYMQRHNLYHIGTAVLKYFVE